MRKFILLMLASLVVFGATISRAQEPSSPAFEVSGVVTSISPVEIRISQKYSQGLYFLYIFKITNKTRIIGQLQKWAFVRVKYSQTYVKEGFFFAAREIRVLGPPNVYYQRMY